MNDASEHKTKDDHEIGAEHMRKAWKGMDTLVENNIRPSITSHSKTKEFKMLSVANIIIFSTLFGVVLTGVNILQNSPINIGEKFPTFLKFTQ